MPAVNTERQGHATDRAVMLGLMGHLPATLDPDAAEITLGELRSTGRMATGAGGPVIGFEEAADTKRRAKRVLNSLRKCSGSRCADSLAALDWVNLWALALNAW